MRTKWPAALATGALLDAAPASALTVVFQDGLATPVLGGSYAGTEDNVLVTNNGGETNQHYGARENMTVGSSRSRTPCATRCCAST